MFKTNEVGKGDFGLRELCIHKELIGVRSQLIAEGKNPNTKIRKASSKSGKNFTNYFHNCIIFRQNRQGEREFFSSSETVLGRGRCAQTPGPKIYQRKPRTRTRRSYFPGKISKVKNYALKFLVATVH